MGQFGDKIDLFGINRIGMYSEKLIEKFWKRVDKQPEGCWLWTGKTIYDGYGYMRMGGNPERVHKISLQLHLSREIQEGMMVCHTPQVCHNRLCVNPNHLREATNIDNCNDKIIDGTQQIGEKAANVKLTEAQVIAIRDDTRTHKQIAEEYGVARTTISAIKRRESWSYL